MLIVHRAVNLPPFCLVKLHRVEDKVTDFLEGSIWLKLYFYVAGSEAEKAFMLIIYENKASAYYVDRGLAEKVNQLFEKPDRTEVDVWVN